MESERIIALIVELKQNFAANLLTVVSKEDSYKILQAYQDAESGALIAHLNRSK